MKNLNHTGAKQRSDSGLTPSAKAHTRKTAMPLPQRGCPQPTPRPSAARAVCFPPAPGPGGGDSARSPVMPPAPQLLLASPLGDAHRGSAPAVGSVVPQPHSGLFGQAAPCLQRCLLESAQEKEASFSDAAARPETTAAREGHPLGKQVAGVLASRAGRAADAAPGVPPAAEVGRVRRARLRLPERRLGRGERQAAPVPSLGPPRRPRPDPSRTPPRQPADLPGQRG